MYIKKIEIDRFGHFADFELSPLRPGLNLIYGQNELGKTTLLEFVRRVLFRFPPKNQNSTFLMENKTQYGGRLFCVNDHQEDIIIERTCSSKKEGDLKITFNGNSIFSGQDALSKITSCSEKFYYNIYAFSIDELHDRSLISAEDVRNELYGCGAELSAGTVSAIQQKLRQANDLIYKKSGSIQQIPKLLDALKKLDEQMRQIRNNLPDYIRSQATLRHHESAKTQLQKSITQAELKLVPLEKQKNAYSEYCELISNEQALGALNTLENFNSQSAVEMKELNVKLHETQKQIEQKTQSARQLAISIDQYPQQFKILEYDQQIIVLSNGLSNYQRDLAEYQILQAEYRQHHQILQGQYQKLLNYILPPSNSTSDMDIVQNDCQLELELLCSEHAQIIQNELLTQARDNSRNEESALHRKLMKKSQYVLLFLGVILGAAAIWQSLYWLVLPSVILILIAGINLYSATKYAPSPHTQLTPNPAELWQEKWQHFLKKNNFLPNLPENAVRHALNLISDYVQQKSSANAVSAKLDSIRERISDFEQKIHQLSENLPGLIEPSADKSPVSIVAVLKKLHQEASVKLLELQQLTTQHRIILAELEHLKEKYRQQQTSHDDFLKFLNCRNDEEFNQKLDEFGEQQRLKQQIRQNKTALLRQLGTTREDDWIYQTLQTFDPLTNQNQIDQIKLDIQNNNAALDKLNIEIGELNNELKNLRSQEDYIVLSQEREFIVEKINLLNREWQINQAALQVLQNAIQKYETERQPAVINYASKFFAAITQNRYRGIRQLITDNTISALNGKNELIELAKLSRGTLEQLLLSIRCGLIAHYEETNQVEPLPILFDDILVNFDYNRSANTITALKEFSQNRQLIMLSCHEHILKEFEQQNANIIYL